MEWRQFRKKSTLICVLPTDRKPVRRARRWEERRQGRVEGDVVMGGGGWWW